MSPQLQASDNPKTLAQVGSSPRCDNRSPSSVLLSSIIPPTNPVVFKESSFFSNNPTARSLPSPEDVRAEAIRQDPTGSKNSLSPPPVHYPSLGLTVKYGARVAASEGQTLWAIRHLFNGVIPVPEVYGWTTDDNVGYVYMEYIRGETLERRWESLSGAQRLDICSQLRLMLTRLRALKQMPGDHFIGNVARQPLLDIVFTNSCSPPVGPIPSVKEFHHLFVTLPHPERCDPNDPPHHFRDRLPDDVPVVFTHGDLHRSNILISRTIEGENPCIVALIDWCQSGWLPSYWEYCKARWTTNIGEEWEAKYIPLFLDKHECYDHWDYFLLTMGI
ncbi:phosphotransferase enzyme family protein-like protein [Ceratobasidium sp. AG-I]|nr:phosphotransferase enzyme family protein-like protein [Ceratobasidium sp. AG-I]